MLGLQLVRLSDGCAHGKRRIEAANLQFADSIISGIQTCDQVREG